MKGKTWQKHCTHTKTYQCRLINKDNLVFLSWWVVEISLSNQSTVRGILTSGCTILRYPMGMDAHIAFNSLRHKRMPCFHERQIPPQMGIHCNQLKAICVCLWSWRSLGASQLHATGPWPSVAPGRLWSESVLPWEIILHDFLFLTATMEQISITRLIWYKNQKCQTWWILR